ncbi:MAG: sigma-70 family RNA polymerase sigma factor [Planctomycetales bacterium]|nr:sigma-70 family RNA polymerase sigma factor [Planctomycetales bacterium]
MSETSASLLDRLRDNPDEESWRQLVEIYTPLIRGWLRRHLQPSADTDDLIQDVLTVVVRRIREFHREPRVGAFRRWLKTITINCLRDFWKSRRNKPRATGNSDFLEVLEQLADPGSQLSQLWDQEHDKHVTHQLLELIRTQFEETTWQAFQRVALDGIPADEVARELGVTVNVVFISKSRVLSKLRQVGAGLLE